MFRLLDAVAQGRSQDVEQFLKEGDSPYTRDERGNQGS